MARKTNGTDSFIAFPEDEPYDATAAEVLRDGFRPPQEIMTEASVRAALRPADLRRLNRDGACAIVVEIPNAAWAPDVEIVMRNLARFAQSFTRTGLSKSQDRPEVGNAIVSACLASGERVLGISQSPEVYLPSTLIASADLRISLRHPTNRDVSSAIRHATGRRPRKLPANVAAGLGIDEISSAIRRYSTPADCVRRLLAASKAKRGGLDASVAEAPLLEDLHGYGEAHAWATALVRDLDEWRAGRLRWDSLSKNCTLSSAPGLGKTSLVRSLARSAGLPLVTTSVSSWFSSSNGYLDGVLKEAHKAIELAAGQSPSILFLDELDGLPNRATMSNRGKDWWVPVVNGILLAIDSTISGPTSRIIVIGATNHADQLDAALIRPGRLHPVIRILPPDAEALAGILRQHLRGDLDGIDLMGVARLGVGASGAEAVAWVKDARRIAREAGRPMRLADLMDRIAPPDTFTPEEIVLFSRHEAAHCCAVEALGVGKVQEVTVGTAGASAGLTRVKLRHGMVMTRDQLDRQVVVSLAGRAQDSLNGGANTGAGGEVFSDLSTATNLVTLAHVSYGLANSLVFSAPSREAHLVLQRDAGLRARVERELQRLYLVAERFVRENQRPIQILAERLIVDRVVDGEEVRRIIAECAAGTAEATVGGAHDQ